MQTEPTVLPAQYKDAAGARMEPTVLTELDGADRRNRLVLNRWCPQELLVQTEPMGLPAQ